MFEDFIGQECVVTVAFSGATVQGGCVPYLYTGKMLEEDENFIKIDVFFIKSVGSIGSLYNNEGTTLINKNYIIAINKI